MTMGEIQASVTLENSGDRRTSPAQAAGVTDTLWTGRDIVTLLEQPEAQETA
jgi:hypothetical protein